MVESATLDAMARLLVSGVSGPIGRSLLPSLVGRGHHVVRLVRQPVRGENQIQWNPETASLSPTTVSGFDAVIHLAGEPIVGRWTEEKKARIRRSRVAATGNLAQALAHSAAKPSVFLTASAIGYYGSRGDELLSEDSQGGDDFLSQVCREWEQATVPAAEAGVRTANLRFGLVLSADGGALPKMLPIFRVGLGGKLGSGQQWWSWVAVEDVVEAIHHILNRGAIAGPVNVVGPQPVRNREFTSILARILHRWTIFPVPAWAARLVFGEMAEALLLASQRVEPRKLISSGYRFRSATLGEALEDLLRPKTRQ